MAAAPTIRLLVTPENVAAGFKRLMGTSTPIEIKGVRTVFVA